MWPERLQKDADYFIIKRKKEGGTMNKDLIKFAAKTAAKIFKTKRKVNTMDNKTLGDVIQLTKLNELMKKDERNEKVAKTVKVVLICTGAFALLAAVGYLIYKLIGRRCDDYDLYDDLDNYYDEADHYDIDLDAHEGDFAE